MKMESAKSFKSANPPFTLADFSQRLRHPETWPPDFAFNYLREDSCARGLAYALGMVDEPTTEGMMKAFGISCRDARQIFNAGWASAYLGRTEITATMVADRIDAVLALQVELA